MIGLNIHLIHVKLNDIDIHQNDKVRVSITTIPEEKKQSFIVDYKNLEDINHFFKVNITKITKKIIIVFRKKSNLKHDPIIASTIIHSDHFPKSKFDSINSELKRINIYEPICNDKNKGKNKENRKILGYMIIQSTIEDAFLENEVSTKSNDVNKLRKEDSFSFSQDENTNYNNLLALVN
ncbi:hypothetical protein M9Y10_007364 [Tritrichomonas musculus]|uniref:Uncharacterized protein n=1 Tax=Tritrichomonas musculus TaxID=1915356 RepID=A0ABR2J1D2_9EUKA